MNPGDLVRVYNRNRLSGLGMLLKRTYLAYETRYCKWLVMFDGEATEMHQSQLRAIKD